MVLLISGFKYQLDIVVNFEVIFPDQNRRCKEFKNANAYE